MGGRGDVMGCFPFSLTQVLCTRCTETTSREPRRIPGGSRSPAGPRRLDLVNLGMHLIKEFEATHWSLLHTVDSRAREGSGPQLQGKESLPGQRRPLTPETQPLPSPLRGHPQEWKWGR